MPEPIPAELPTVRASSRPEAPKYWVHWSYCYENALPFYDFDEALACFKTHKDDPDGNAIMTGESYEPADENSDGKSSGLTEAEQEAIDAC